MQINNLAHISQQNNLETPVWTGARRYRVFKRWFKPDLLVLQVEFQGVVYDMLGPSCTSKIKTWWKDAKPEWMMTYTKN